MSIFNRREPVPPKQPQKQPAVQPAARTTTPRPASVEPSGGREQTHIANGSKVIGKVSGNAELVVDGHVEGEIDLDSRLIIGAKGQVTGEVKARSVQINGRVQGNVEGLERVEVLRSGRLEGDMVAPQNGVHIAEGAFFTGKIDMTQAVDTKGQQKKS